MAREGIEKGKMEGKREIICFCLHHARHWFGHGKNGSASQMGETALSKLYGGGGVKKGGSPTTGIANLLLALFSPLIPLFLASFYFLSSWHSRIGFKDDVYNPYFHGKWMTIINCVFSELSCRPPSDVS